MGSRGRTYPLTAERCVDLIVTNLAVVEVTDEGLALQEVAPGLRPTKSRRRQQRGS
jgi:acyl CoA:acetate/3-ketoacid CoA transferase beta subunit